mgnify:CR=1 FL=1
MENINFTKIELIKGGQGFSAKWNYRKNTSYIEDGRKSMQRCHPDLIRGFLKLRSHFLRASSILGPSSFKTLDRLTEEERQYFDKALEETVVKYIGFNSRNEVYIGGYYPVFPGKVINVLTPGISDDFENEDDFYFKYKQELYQIIDEIEKEAKLYIFHEKNDEENLFDGVTEEGFDDNQLVDKEYREEESE